MPALKFFLVLVVLIGSPLVTLAQPNLFELASAPDPEFMRNVFVESVHSSLSKSVKKGEIQPRDLEINKVGLLTFSIYELNHSKEKGQLTYTYSKDGGTLPQRIYDLSLAQMKASANKRSITLLEPTEYLVSDAHRQQYIKALDDIKTLIGKKVDLYGTLEASNLQSTPKGMGFVAAFFEEGKDPEINRILADLCQSLGLDALLSVQLSTSGTNISIALTNAQMILHGQNPVEENKAGTGLKWGGFYYIPDVPMAFVGLEKGQVSGEDLRAFAPLLGRMTHDFMEMLQMEHEMLFKP